LLETLQRLQAIGSQRHPVAFALQQALRDAAHRDRIVHHQHQRNVADRHGRSRLTAVSFNHHRLLLLVQPSPNLRAIHRRQRHRVVNQGDRSRSQHRHTRQPWQARELRPQVFHHHFLVAQHLVHVHGQALRRTAEHHHRQGTPLWLGRSHRRHQQGTAPVKRHVLVSHTQRVLAVGLRQFVSTDPAHHFHEVGRHTQCDIPRTQHDHLRDRRGQGQHQLEGGAHARLGTGFNASAQCQHVVTHHVHAHATPGQFGHFVHGAQSSRKHQLCSGLVTDNGTRCQHTFVHRFLPQQRQVQPSTVVGKQHRHVVERLRHANSDASFCRFALCQPNLGLFNAMHHAVAQQVFKGRGDAVEHATVHFNLTAHNVQPHQLAGFFGRLTHHPVKAFGNAFKLHHARAQQIALQFAGLARLGDQTIFGRFHGPLQVALHGSHVVDRLGHHAGEFLHAGVAVKFQRVKGMFHIARQPRLHLAFGLQLNVAQLLAQAIQVARQVFERGAQVHQLGLHARAGDHDLTNLVDQTIQQLRAHTHRSSHTGLHRGGQARQIHRTCQLLSGRWIDDRGKRHQRIGLCGYLRRWCGWQLRCLLNGVLCLRIGTAEGFKALDDRIESGLQGLQVGAALYVRAQTLGCRFHAVHHLTQAQGPGQTRTAFEGVQIPQNLGACRAVVRMGHPLAQGGIEQRQQFVSLIRKNRKQIHVDGVHRIDVVINVLLGRHRNRGHALVTVRRQRLWHRQQHRYFGLLHRLLRLRHGLHRFDGLKRRSQFDGLHHLDDGFCLNRLGNQLKRLGQRFIGPRTGLGRQALQHRFGFRFGSGFVNQCKQPVEQLWPGCLQKTCCELVQQTANVLRCRQQQGYLIWRDGTPCFLAQADRLTSMLQRTGQIRQGLKTDCRRTACQRVRQALSLCRQGQVPLVRPGVHGLIQATRPFISLAQVNPKQLGTNAQMTDDAGLVVTAAGKTGGLRHGSGHHGWFGHGFWCGQRCGHRQGVYRLRDRNRVGWQRTGFRPVQLKGEVGQHRRRYIQHGQRNLWLGHGLLFDCRGFNLLERLFKQGKVNAIDRIEAVLSRCDIRRFRRHPLCHGCSVWLHRPVLRPFNGLIHRQAEGLRNDRFRHGRCFLRQLGHVRKLRDFGHVGDVDGLHQIGRPLQHRQFRFNKLHDRRL